MAKLQILATVFLTACVSDAAKILVLFPSVGPSHRILAEGYVRHLTASGHEVTLVTPYPTNDTNSKLRQIDVHENLIPLQDIMSVLSLESIMNNPMEMADQRFTINLFGSVARSTLRNEKMQKILNDPNEHFDLVIGEWLYDEIYSGLGYVFNCPFIWSSTLDPHWMVMRLIDEPTNPAYVADSMSPIVPPFTLVQRLQELWTVIWVTAVKAFHYDVIVENAYNDIYGPILAKKGRPLPAFQDVMYNASLMLGNSHVSFGQPTKLPQNYKPIGGYHVETEVKPLPQDLQMIFDNAKHGVIYFSMGSNLQSSQLPNVLKTSLLKMFGTLKYTVVWKFEEMLPDKPENVHNCEMGTTAEYFRAKASHLDSYTFQSRATSGQSFNQHPERLTISTWAYFSAGNYFLAPDKAHPNCILFITHGGLLSTTEAVHFGKPTIPIPVYGDQFINSMSAVNKGFAKKVKLSYNLDVDLKEAIVEVTSNPRYSQKAKELSFIYHDRPVSPGKELVHWVEHVIATGGAPHLRSPALMLPWYQKMYFDLLGLILAILISINFVIKQLFTSKIDSQKKNK